MPALYGARLLTGLGLGEGGPELVSARLELGSYAAGRDAGSLQIQTFAKGRQYATGDGRGRTAVAIRLRSRAAAAGHGF